jgi:hypothetical protein
MSSQPSPHYRQHHEVDAPRVDTQAFRQGWRVRTRLDGMLAAGLISAAGWQAGADFRVKWERAYGQGIAPATGMMGVRASHGDRMAAGRIDAVTWLRRAHDALGERQFWLIERCAVHDASWVSIAADLAIDDKRARALTAQALGALAEIWR